MRREALTALAGSLLVAGLLTGCTVEAEQADPGLVSADDASSDPSVPSSPSVDPAVQAAFERELRDRLTLPPLPSFTIPTELLTSTQNQRISADLELQPGLYQGIAVLDARCTTPGQAAPADSGTPITGAAGAAHFDDGNRSITLAGDGTGVYDAPGLHIAVLPGGAGVYDDDQTRVSVSQDGGGTYRDGEIRLTVRADGSGSFSDDDTRFWIGEDGSGGYEDETTRVTRRSTGEAFGDGDPAHVAAVTDVLDGARPPFPPCLPPRSCNPPGRSAAQ